MKSQQLTLEKFITIYFFVNKSFSQSDIQIKSYKWVQRSLLLTPCAVSYELDERWMRGEGNFATLRFCCLTIHTFKCFPAVHNNRSLCLFFLSLLSFVNKMDKALPNWFKSIWQTWLASLRFEWAFHSIWWLGEYLFSFLLLFFFFFFSKCFGLFFNHLRGLSNGSEQVYLQSFLVLIVFKSLVDAIKRSDDPFTSVISSHLDAMLSLRDGDLVAACGNYNSLIR